MKSLWLAFVFTLAPVFALAQVVNPATVTFTSTDHNAVIPAGQTNAGQPVVASYQASIFPIAADPASGVAVVTGPVIAKAQATPQATANTYKLTFAQLGVVTPVCGATPCPQYTLVLVSIGPNGRSALAVASESNPFTAAVPIQGPPPASPVNVVVGP